ncbi:MAG: hypothetical protein R2741_01775 [Methanolobus sp.]
MIVEGNFFGAKINQNEFSRLISRITRFMDDRGYYSLTGYPQYDGYLSISYYLDNHTPLPILEQLKVLLHLKSKSDANDKSYSNKLAKTRNDMAYKVDFLVYDIKKVEGYEGYFIRVHSEPVILYKIRQLGHSSNLSKFTYSDIVYNNKHFVDEIILGLGGTKLEETKTLTDLVKPPIVDRLNELGFVRVANLLKEGMEKIERGDIEDGLTDLRSAVEMFVFDIVEKKNLKPSTQHKLKENLNLLKSEGFLDEKMTSLLNNIVVSWLYHHLSDKAVHKREDMNLIDARFLFKFTEEVMEYMLQRIIIHRI